MRFVRTVTILAFLATLSFSVSSAHANGVPLTNGNVLAAVGDSSVKQFTPTGTLKDTLNDGSGSYNTTGMCFDPARNLYVTNFSTGTVSKFSAAGVLINSTFASGFNAPESCIFDRAGNMYVGQADSNQIAKVDSAGVTVATYTVTTGARGTDFIDLAADQCTMLYNSEDSTLRRYNVCTSTQLTPIAVAPNGEECFAVRIRPDGTILDACTTDIYLFSASGAVLRTYPAATYGDSFFFALNLDPDNTTFWTGDLGNGNVVRINIATGAQVVQFNSAPFSELAGLAIVGEISVAGGGNNGVPCTMPCSVYASFSQTYPTGNVSATVNLSKNSSGGFTSGGISFSDTRPGGVTMPGCTFVQSNCRLTVTSFNCLSPNEALITGTFTVHGGTTMDYTIDVGGSAGTASKFTITIGAYTYSYTGKYFAVVKCTVAS